MTHYSKARLFVWTCASICYSFSFVFVFCFLLFEVHGTRDQHVCLVRPCRSACRSVVLALIVMMIVCVCVIACAVVIVVCDSPGYKCINQFVWFYSDSFTSCPKQAQHQPVAATETWYEPPLAHQTWTAEQQYQCP
jgi:hypothetical protein